MSQVLNIALVAEEAAGVQTFKQLVQSGHRVVAVLTASSVENDSRGVTVAHLAEKQGIPTWPAKQTKKAELAQELRDLGVDLLLNTHSLYIVHPDVLAAPKIGSFNLHPGPLPEMAGINVPSWAVYLGHARHGVSLHWMSPGIDTGPMAYGASFDLAPTDTGISVSLNCVRLGIPLVRQLVETAATDPGLIPKQPQDLSRRRYFGREVPLEGCIKWSLSASELERLVRASRYLPFPSPWGIPSFQCDGQCFVLVQAARTGQLCSEVPGTACELDGKLAVATGDEWLLVTQVFHEGKNVPPLALLRPGIRFQDGHSPRPSASSLSPAALVPQR